MFEVRNLTRLFSGTIFVTLLAFVAVQVHVEVNYPPEMRDFVRTKASLATIAITFPISLIFGYQLLKNWRLSDELRRLVSRDRLTNLSTRDHFFSSLAEMPDLYGVILMVDIDHFKQVNDTHGHLAGDRVIEQVAKGLKQQMRAQDLICRFGGEEFVIFLPETTEVVATTVAEKLRYSIDKTPIWYDGQAIHVTLSVGVSLETAAQHIEEAIRQADAALYCAKNSGRNRISGTAVVTSGKLQKTA